MKTLAVVSALLSLAAGLAIPEDATPLEIISSRPLTIEERSSCPKGGDLPKGALQPTLMVPISKNLPDVAFGPTWNPIVTPNDFCTIFNLVIPSSGFNKTCTLEFLFPSHGQTFSPYIYNGAGHFTFTGYAFFSGATPETTYNNQPPPGPSPPSPPAVLAPGNAYVINAGPCFIPEGEASMEVSGALCSPDTDLVYLQTENMGCPIGFYVVISDPEE